MNFVKKDFRDTCILTTGNSINAEEKKKKYENVKEGLPYIATKDISKQGDINFLNGITIPKRYQKNFRLAKSKSIFLCIEGGSAGKKIAFSDKNAFFGNKLINISSKDDNELDPRYLYYFTRSDFFAKQFKNAINGIIGGASKRKIENFNIFYPDKISTQKRIIDKLEENSLITSKTVDQILDINVKLDNIFKRILENKIFNNQDNWKESRLEDLMTLKLQNGHSPKSEKFNNGGLRVLTLSAVTHFDFLPDQVKFSTNKIKNESDFLIEEGEFLISRGNVRNLVGHCAIVSNLKHPTIFPDLMMRVTLDKDIIIPEYLYYYLQTPSMRKHIESVARGANPSMVKINQKNVNGFVISYPSISLQKELVQFFDHAKLNIMGIKSLYESKMQLLKKQNQVFINKLLNNE